MHTEHIQISELCVHIKKRMSLNLRKKSVLSAFREIQQHGSPYVSTNSHPKTILLGPNSIRHDLLLS